MTPFAVYMDYLALRNHFNTDWYDYIKYGGKTKANLDSFQSRKDRVFFEKLAKHRDPHGLMLANFVKSPKVWARDLAYSEECEQNYIEWLKRTQALTNTVRSELSKLDEQFDSNFVVEDGQHPTLLRLYCASEVSAETLCTLVDLTKCFKHWCTMDGDVVWDEVKRLLIKYTPFVKYDRDKVKRVVVDFFAS